MEKIVGGFPIVEHRFHDGHMKRNMERLVRVELFTTKMGIR